MIRTRQHDIPPDPADLIFDAPIVGRHQNAIQAARHPNAPVNVLDQCPSID